MPNPPRSRSWFDRLRDGLARLAAWLGMGRADQVPAPEPGAPYPDYVTCPHCGEPEVEVWSNATVGQCHNCGQEFPFPGPAAAPPD